MLAGPNWIILFKNCQVLLERRSSVTSNAGSGLPSTWPGLWRSPSPRVARRGRRPPSTALWTRAWWVPLISLMHPFCDSQLVFHCPQLNDFNDNRKLMTKKYFWRKCCKCFYASCNNAGVWGHLSEKLLYFSHQCSSFWKTGPNS